MAARRKRKLRFQRVEVRFAEDLPPGIYWAIYCCQPFGRSEWFVLQRERPTYEGKARVKPHTIVGPRRQLEGVVVLTADRRLRWADASERLAAGDLALVV